VASLISVCSVTCAGGAGLNRGLITDPAGARAAHPPTSKHPARSVKLRNLDRLLPALSKSLFEKGSRGREEALIMGKRADSLIDLSLLKSAATSNGIIQTGSNRLIHLGF
jgi:hypothetical protein